MSGRGDFPAGAAGTGTQAGGENHLARMRRETAEEKARRLMQEELDKLGWTAKDLVQRSKGDVRKVRLARRLWEWDDFFDCSSDIAGGR